MISIDLTFRHALRLLLLGGAGLVEQGLHGGVLAGKFLYGEILGLVVSQTQVTFCLLYTSGKRQKRLEKRPRLEPRIQESFARIGSEPLLGPVDAGL